MMLANSVTAAQGAELVARVTKIAGTVEKLAPDGLKHFETRQVRVKEEITVSTSSDAMSSADVSVARWLPLRAIPQSVRRIHPTDSMKSRRGAPSKIAWRLDNHSGILSWNCPVDGSASWTFSVTYAVSNAVLPVPSSPYQGIFLASVRWPIRLGVVAMSKTDATSMATALDTASSASSLVDCNVSLSVNQWDPVRQFVLCGQRPFAMYSRSGYAIRSESGCHACPLLSRRRGSDLAEESCSRLGTQINGRLVAQLDSTADTKVSAWMVTLFAGTEREEVAVAAPSRTAYCRRLMHHQSVEWIEQFVGDLAYPVKVLVTVIPVAMLTMVAAVVLARRFLLVGLVAAVGSNIVDLLLISASGVFPTCSVAVAGAGLGIGDVLALGMYYAVSGGAFWYVDKMVSERFVLPESIGQFHVARWGPTLARKMPSWMPLPLAVGLVYFMTLLTWATELFSMTEAFGVAAVILNVALWLPVLKALKQIIAIRTQGGGPAVTALRVGFVLWLVEPILLLYLGATNPASAAWLAGTATILGVIVSRSGAEYGTPQFTPPTPLGDPAQLESLKRLSRLRPKQRALLQGATP